MFLQGVRYPLSMFKIHRKISGYSHNEEILRVYVYALIYQQFLLGTFLIRDIESRRTFFASEYLRRLITTLAWHIKWKIRIYLTQSAKHSTRRYRFINFWLKGKSLEKVLEK